MDESRPKTPTAPAVGRTPTAEELSRAINRLNESLNKRLVHVERAADDSLLPFIRETGARYTEVATALAGVSATVGEFKKSIDQWRADIVKDLDAHDDRLMAVEKRGTEHHVRLATHDESLDDQHVRIRSLEQHRDGDARELALTRRQKTGMAALGTAGGGIAWLLSHLLGG